MANGCRRDEHDPEGAVDSGGPSAGCSHKDRSKMSKSLGHVQPIRKS